jgi:hypothetical protein
MKKFKSWINENMSTGASTMRGMGYVTGSPDGESGDYVGDNIADADNRNNVIKTMSTQHINMHKSTKATKGK